MTFSQPLGGRSSVFLTEAPTLGKLPALGPPPDPASTRAPAASPAPGQVLAERYTVLDVLGHGGMGLVLAAHDSRLNRRVALKLLRPRWCLDDSDSQVRLLREAQAMAQLNHPHVVHVYDSGQLEDDALFIAMEYVEGQTLRHWLQQQPRTWRQVLRAFLEAGQGLSAAHDAGLVHRDFKPDNVLVGEDRRIRVMDFGVAQAMPAPGAAPREAPRSLPRAWVEPLTESGSLLGTPRYMAPEQLQRQPVDARSDLFAFCVALYEALYDQPPFEGDDFSELLEARQAERLVPPPAQTEVPAWVGRAVLRGLKADPHQRPGSMRELLAELEDDPRQRWRAWLTRGELVGAGALLLLTLLWGWTHPREPASTVVPLPEEPAVQAQAKPLMRQVDQLEALFHSGLYEEGLALAAQLRPQTAVLGHPLLHGRTLYWSAMLLDATGDYPGAEALVREALVQSARGKDAVQETRAWNLLVTVVGVRQARYAEALWLELPLMTAAEHAGDERHLALALETLGHLRWTMGDSAQAREHYARARALREKTEARQGGPVPGGPP